MSDPQEDFIKFAIKHGQETIAGNASATNKAYGRIITALRVLRKTPDKGEAFFLKCLEASDGSLVTWAALYLLRYREHEATEALERIAGSDAKLVSFGAEMTLREWRAGRLKPE